MGKHYSRRVWGYGLAALALLGVLVVGPRAWATPEQSRSGLNVTVPTVTPVVVWSPSPLPVQPTATVKPPPATDVPPANPTATVLAPVSPPGTPTTPPPTPTATVSTASGATLALVKAAARREAWPGATVHYTLALTNTGSASARQVTLEDTLPDGLEPGAVQGETAAWDGRTLRASVPLLPPGGRLEVAFSAVVRPDVAVGGLLVNRARATAAGGLTASAEMVTVLPPAELPVVGGALRDLRPLR